jgi:putative ABC transport system permease protein
MKALGANNRQVMLLFLAEGAALGLLGGLGGYIVGALLASELGRRLFGVSLQWAWWVGPLVCLATVMLAVLATFLPVRSVRAVNPAMVLKGA